VEVEAVYPDGTTVCHTVTYSEPQTADYTFEREHFIHRNEKLFTAANATSLSLNGAVIVSEPGALNTNAVLSITTLRAVDIPALDAGMVNVTKGHAGFRLLPHGSVFNKELHVTIPYDSASIPDGYTAQDIRTYYFDEHLHETDHLNLFYYNLNFRNQSTFKMGVSNEYIKLLTPFDPTNSGKDTLAAGSKHHWNALQAEYVSKPRSLFTYSFSARSGAYYAKGSLHNIVGQVGYRFQPHATIYGNFSYNQIELPHPWDVTRFWLIGCQFDLTLTNTVFFSTFFQYNEQLKNMNLNSRFQWRYAPASDLFIVYTDNYLPSPFQVRNRALVVKMTYWWNR
jgi:hypothetical protein